MKEFKGDTEIIKYTYTYSPSFPSPYSATSPHIFSKRTIYPSMFLYVNAREHSTKSEFQHVEETPLFKCFWYHVAASFIPVSKISTKPPNKSSKTSHILQHSLILLTQTCCFPPKKTSLYRHPPSYFTYHCRKKKPPPKRHCDEGMQSCDTRPDPMELSQLWFSLGEVQKPDIFQVM